MDGENGDGTTLPRIRRFDLAGFVLSAVGFDTLVFGIIEGPKIGFFTQIRTFFIGRSPGRPISPRLRASPWSSRRCL